MLLVFTAFSGCGGEKDSEEYSGPIDLVLILSANSGTLEITKIDDNETIDQQTNPVTIEFDVSNTTSGSGDIIGFTIDPGDGSAIIEFNEGVISHDYSVHGVFEAIITATDSEENERSVTKEIRINYNQNHDNTNTADPDIVWVDYIGPSTDIPMWINVTSNVVNTPAGFIGDALGNNDPVTVTWTLYDGLDNVANTTTEIIEDGDSFEIGYQAEMPITIDWRLEITLEEEGVNVNTETVFDISYDHSGM